MNAAASDLSNLISASTNRQSLIKSLICPSVYWAPLLVDTILKQLWNHGPKALQFFHILLHNHPTYVHSASSFDHAIASPRLRHRLHPLRLHLTPKTFSIIAERIYILLTLSSMSYVKLDVLRKHGTFSKCSEEGFKLMLSVITYNIIANGWCSIKRTNKALETLKETVERGLSPNLTTYNIILKRYFRAGQIDVGWKFFLEMKRRKIEFDVVTYTTVVHGLGVAGEIKRAQNVFNQMVDDGVLPSVATYNALIQVLCMKDSVENVVSVFESMLKKGYAPNSTTYNVVLGTYNIVIRYFCNAGEIERGLELFEKMNGGVCLPNLDTYNVLIRAMFARKRSDDMLVAGKLLVEMVDRGFTPRSLTFNRVLDGLLLTGNQSFAKEILRLQGGCGRFSRRFKL
ncbi:Pentatricopeptide repeat-containing protein [Hibiscus syriacus]|uniref:Pentatricopeptide repeat-containing protein n=1 Tax=Hibiscus syriacus TaxID=106335 RepID=A0A6A3BW43_HIBSY|nr:Pentatricopeptide repeat-containing protein [Hibiscus syriacus]